MRVFCHRWISLSTDHLKENKALMPYHVQRQPGYEPYVIISRDVFIPYDERFRGYALNKIVQLEWMAARGGQYYVLPGHFVVEEEHPNGANFKAVVQTVHHQRLIAMYDSCQAEMNTGIMPRISNTTRWLFSKYNIAVPPPPLVPHQPRSASI